MLWPLKRHLLSLSSMSLRSVPLGPKDALRTCRRGELRAVPDLCSWDTRCAGGSPVPSPLVFPKHQPGRLMHQRLSQCGEHIKTPSMNTASPRPFLTSIRTLPHASLQAFIPELPSTSHRPDPRPHFRPASPEFATGRGQESAINE